MYISNFQKHKYEISWFAFCRPDLMNEIGAKWPINLYGPVDQEISTQCSLSSKKW